ncbi:2-phospho-L-lactate guanylyltransferase [Microbacterium sp. EYE_5]|uniref:2-phospho-L-lactate guanylyltransferase n=1 Tax=unclassified Microbacterium TaxID=2609290 RepID=UPI002005E8DD|nr:MULTISPECIES: 2-phospho-L-lactate guanylyltransferase [unclassified Microbacterium]MCK6080089.1 2-phospho-L-lactate guanylyltransferase [Microbacterium sp. EYE_382]MCK6085360.1 2-phospho-L-lactate guanylyltransferase [Microbacterium sp. EYE_384]MCK6122415.1 2-phospho-L-lactate guanylyltransferase [Microbacterium sp. EYE_80]MCK6126123.1 2-phospho-L-lactate guanylyltransferase [Microbacterium sp. EYE_79]MCK6141044.1 2-phospho-L-lactate guanylyltransferase [Microbacterium sp. EYE_39]
MSGRGWAVMIPVKPFADAKSRLGDDIRRGGIARALALDTIDVATRTAGVARVIVVTADAALASLLPGGVELVREREPAGIDAALLAASARVGLRRHRASLPADLAALAPAELAAALSMAAGVPRAVIPDAAGTGSTLVTARAGVPWASAYGTESFSQHVALGCRPLPVRATSGLRWDLDTPDDLAGLLPRAGERVRGVA